MSNIFTVKEPAHVSFRPIWSNSGDTIITLGRGITAWSFPALSLKYHIRPATGRVHGLTPDGSELVVNSQYEVVWVSVADGIVTRRLTTSHLGLFYIHAISHDGDFLVISNEQYSAGKLKFVSIETGEVVSSISLEDESRRISNLQQIEEGQWSIVSRSRKGGIAEATWRVTISGPGPEFDQIRVVNLPSETRDVQLIMPDGELAIVRLTKPQNKYEYSVYSLARGEIVTSLDLPNGSWTHAPSTSHFIHYDYGYKGVRKTRVVSVSGEILHTFINSDTISFCPTDELIGAGTVGSSHYDDISSLFVVSNISENEEEITIPEYITTPLDISVGSSNWWFEHIWDPVKENQPIPGTDEEISELFAREQKSTYFPKRNFDDGDSLSHYGGAPLLKVNEEWPTCGCCGQRMPLFLQLLASDWPDEEDCPFEGVLQVFICTTSPSSDPCCETHLPFSSAHLVRLLNDPSTLSVAILDMDYCFLKVCIEGWTKASSYPSWSEYDDRFKEIWHNDKMSDMYDNLDQAAGDRLLGWPDWVQNTSYPKCQVCGSKLNYILTLNSDDSVPFMFGDGGVGNVFYCPKHPDVLTFSWDGS